MSTLILAPQAEYSAVLLPPDAEFRFELWSHAHPRWREGLCFVCDTYRARGLPMVPADDAAVVRLCALDAQTGALRGTIGLRQTGFSCVTSFPVEFAHRVGAAPAVELTQFAVASEQGATLKTTLALLRVLVSHVQALGAQFVVCEARPSHASFYAFAGIVEVARHDMVNWPPKLFLVGEVSAMVERLYQGPLRRRGLPHAHPPVPCCPSVPA